MSTTRANDGTIVTGPGTGTPNYGSTVTAQTVNGPKQMIWQNGVLVPAK